MATIPTSNILKSTYFKGGLRTGLNSISSPQGPDVNISPLFFYTVTPIVETTAYTAFTGATGLSITAGQPVPLSGSPAAPLVTQPGLPQKVIAFDCHRCLGFKFSKVDNPNNFSVTITGYDDRYVMVQETINFSLATSSSLVSNKAYSYLQSVVFNSSPWSSVPGTVTIGYSKYALGLPIFAPSIINALTWASSTSSPYLPAGIPFSSTTIAAVPTTTIPPLNFYKTVPSNAAVGGSADGPTFATVNQDARGIVSVNTAMDASTIYTYRMALYAYGADAFIQNQLKSQNPLIVQNYQYQITQLNKPPVTGALTKSNFGAPLTTLTPFDLYGVQYPGDKAAWNKMALPTAQMV